MSKYRYHVRGQVKGRRRFLIEIEAQSEAQVKCMGVAYAQHLYGSLAQVDEADFSAECLGVSARKGVGK